MNTIKKNILYLRTDLLDKPLIAGGSVTHSFGVIKGYMQQGFEIVLASSLIMPALDGLPFKQKIQLSNPKWISFLRWRINCVLSNIFFTWQTYKLCKTYTFSCLYQRYTPFNATGVLLQWWFNIPLILEYNSSFVWIDDNWITLSRFRLRWLMVLIEKVNVKHAHTIVVVSQVLYDELINRGIDAHKILVNPNGVDPDSFDPEKLQSSRERIRMHYGFKDSFVYGFVGTFGMWHGMDILTDAIIKLSKQDYAFHVLLIGDGVYKSDMERKLKEHNCLSHVIFTGLVPSQQAREYLSACDAFVSPTVANKDGSPFFGSPTKIFEYMSLAKPIIASDLDQLSEIFNEAVKASNNYEFNSDSTAVLVQPGDYKQLAEGMKRVALWPSECKKHMGSKARKKVISDYTWRVHVEKINQFVNR